MQGVGAADFAARMASIGPFEPGPDLAVAVSGGRDSLALCLLAAVWARRRRARLTALTVDHGLRPESAAEARAVHNLLGRHGIAHRILVWRGEKPSTGIEAAGREARYDLLTGWCRRQGIFHLLTGHHQDDQAETFLMRLAAGSGPDGLAAMAPVSIRDGVRLLRPLLGVPRDRLAETLRRRGVRWIDDPSNADVRFARARLRASIAGLEAQGLSTDRLGAAAASLGRMRAGTDRAVAALLARAARVSPLGYGVLDRVRLADAEPEIAWRALGRILGVIGGGAYPLRTERVERLRSKLLAGQGFPGGTLGGCRLFTYRGALYICREVRAGGTRLDVVPGWRGRWDGRFEIAIARGAARSGASLAVAPLGAEGLRQVRRRGQASGPALPAPVLRALPALWDIEGLLSIPYLMYERERPAGRSRALLQARFWPRRPLTPAIAGAS